MLPKAHLISHSKMSGSRWVTAPSWLSRSLRPFLYSSYIYFCHLLLISSCFFRYTLFLSFIVPIFAWNFPLVCLIFLMQRLVILILLFFSISLHCSHKQSFLSLCYSLEPCIQMGISFLLLCFSLLTSAFCKASSDNHFALFHFPFLGMVLDTASCPMLWNSIHSSSGTLSALIPWMYLMVSLYNHKGFDLVHTRMAEWVFFFFFSTFSSFSLNFAIRCSWSDSQSGSGLVLPECTRILHI